MCLFFVFISAILLCFIPTSKRSVKAETFSFETDIINKWGNWEFNENNAVATNANSGNEFIVTKHNATKQQEVVMKADVSFTTGAGTGFAPYAALLKKLLRKSNLFDVINTDLW